MLVSGRECGPEASKRIDDGSGGVMLTNATGFHHAPQPVTSRPIASENDYSHKECRTRPTPWDPSAPPPEKVFS
jgi:hypothetical protein